jgi:hypothetical protein
LAISFQGDFILPRQFNFGMASLDRVVRSLLDSFDEGQIKSYAHSADEEALSRYLTNMIEREPPLPPPWALSWRRRAAQQLLPPPAAPGEV